MPKLEKLPSVHQNLNVALTDCPFVHMHQGEAIGSGVITRALNSENIEALYTRMGETDKRRVVLNVSMLHYDGLTDSGFCLGEQQHAYEEVGV